MDIARPGRRRPIICSYCGRACFNSRDLKSHMAYHAPGDLGRKGDFVPRCDGCDKSFENFEAYEAHMDLFHEGLSVRKEAPDGSQSRRKKRSKHKRGNQKGKDSVTECPAVGSSDLEAHYRDKEPDTCQSSSKEPNASQSGSKEPDASLSGRKEPDTSRSRRKKHHGGASKSHKRGKKRASQTHRKDIFMECPECSVKVHPSTKEPDTSQSGTELVRCRCCDEPFYSWRPYRDHLLDKFWKPAADKKPGSKPYDFPVMEIFTGFEAQLQNEEDSISSDVSTLSISTSEDSKQRADVSTLSICSEDTQQRVPPKNWMRALYCQNLDKMEAEGYDFDKDSIWDRALPPDFPLGDTKHTSPEAERDRIRENNERLRKKFNLGPDDLYYLPGMEWREFDDDLSD